MRLCHRPHPHSIAREHAAMSAMLSVALQILLRRLTAVPCQLVPWYKPTPTFYLRTAAQYSTRFFTHPWVLLPALKARIDSCPNHRALECVYVATVGKEHLSSSKHLVRAQLSIYPATAHAFVLCGTQ